MVLFAGTLLYNEIVSVRCLGSAREEEDGPDDVKEPLLRSEQDEEA